MIKMKSVVISKKLLSPPIFFIIIYKFNVFYVNYNVFFMKKQTISDSGILLSFAEFSKHFTGCRYVTWLLWIHNAKNGG